MRARLAVLALLTATIGLGLVAPAAAKPKPVKPGQTFTVACPAGAEALGGVVAWYDRRSQSIGSSTGVPSGGSVTFGPAPKGAAFAVVTSLDCLQVSYLEGTAPVTDQGLIIYGLPGLPIPGGTPATVQDCPAGSALDFGRSTFTHPPNLTVDYFADFGVVIVTAALDTTGTISYRLACVSGVL
jgi:hypothetical protein